MLRRLGLATVLTALAPVAACNGDAPAPAAEAPVPAADAEAAKKAAVEKDAAEAVAAKTPPPLSEEDKRLIALDPSTLTPEMRRKRAYAMRRKVMQNPDSPTARALNDLAAAHRDGVLTKDGDMPTFSLGGQKPTSGRPPAGVRTSETPAPAPAPQDTP